MSFIKFMKNIILALFIAVGVVSSADASNKPPEEKKAFYAPADKFPKDPVGIKLVGYFKVMGDAKIGYYLTADAEAGERDNMRRFNLPAEVQVNLGDKFKITKDAPLIVSSGGILGGYDVRVPTAQSQSRPNSNTTKSETAATATGERATADVGDPLGIESELKAVNEARSHFNDGSIIFEIEKGGNPTIALPTNLTQGGIEFIPALSQIAATREGINPENYLAKATFKDTLNPKVYYVYEIDNAHENLGKVPFLGGINIYIFKDPSGYDEIDACIKNKQTPLVGWNHNEKITHFSIMNNYNLLNSNGNPSGRPSDREVDILTPMYRSYDKFVEWNKIASDKKPPNFDKPFPNKLGVFKWMNPDNDPKNNQIGLLCPVPPSGYQPSRVIYAGWSEEQVNEIMRALYFYPSARSQIATYIKDQISKVQSSKKDIENSFK